MVPIADDSVLVDAARGGDLDAFEALVRRYQGPVYRVALRMLGSESDAEDAAQETFVRAWRSLARFRGDSAFGTWLYRIVTNRCLNAIAARRPVEALTDAHADPDADPAAVAERRERLLAVADAILALPPDQRAALVLREFQGLAYEEVAEVLGVSLTAVKGRIHRARRSLVRARGGGVNGLAERLPCGVPLLALVEQVSGARSPDDPAHQTRCPHCRRALGRIRAVLDEVRRLAADPVAIPPGLARQVMERLRGKPTEIPLAPGPRGRTSVSDATVAQVARRAALTAPGVVFASALVVSGTAGESLRVTVHLVVAFGPPIGEVAARVRERVARDVARLAGIRPDAIEIAVDDIAP